MTEQPTTDVLRAWITAEQVGLWYDLSTYLDQAINHAWSMDAADCCQRIISAARLVGATSNGDIPWPLVGGGVHAALYDLAGITHDSPSGEDMEVLGAEMDRLNGGDVAEHARRYAATVAAMRDPREVAFIVDLTHE